MIVSMCVGMSSCVFVSGNVCVSVCVCVCFCKSKTVREGLRYGKRKNLFVLDIILPKKK